MTPESFRQSLTATEPPAGLTLALAGLWWNANGDWARAHESAQQGERMHGWIVGSRLHAPEGRRSGQRNILVQPIRQTRLPRATRCGMAQHRERPTRISASDGVGLFPQKTAGVSQSFAIYLSVFSIESICFFNSFNTVLKGWVKLYLEGTLPSCRLPFVGCI
jgi:hypothetical protein